MFYLIISKLIEYFDQLKTFSISEIYHDSYIEIGPIKNSKIKTINKGILITPFITIDSINYAIQQKYNLIITRLSLIKNNLNTLDEKINSLLYLLFQSHIIVYNIGYLWEFNKDGGIEYFINLLGLQITKILKINQDFQKYLICFICNFIDKINLKNFIENIKRILLMDIIKTYNFNESRMILNQIHYYYFILIILIMLK